jgi:hypothetical protein
MLQHGMQGSRIIDRFDEFLVLMVGYMHPSRLEAQVAMESGIGAAGV